MSKAGSTWQHRVADTIEERFGLLDDPKRGIYKKQPVFEEPEGSVKKKKKQLTACGITCGIGSMLVGAQDLGFRVLGNLEWRDYYRYRVGGRPSTFVNNFPGAFMARGLNDVPEELFPGDIDFAAGHPECGRYSQLSHSVQSGNGAYQASRGSDVSDIPLFLKLVARLKPRFFLMDDLPASFGPLPMEKYVELLPEYDLFPEWVSNWGYGNIQKHRNRMFVVGALKSEKFVFRPGEFTHELRVQDIIGDLVDFTEDIPNHQTVDEDYIPGRYVNMNYLGHRPSWKELRQSNHDFRKQTPYITKDGEEKIRPGTWSPRWDDTTCPVLSGGFNPIHALRRLPFSIRERARIQGFPDDFIFNFDEAGPHREIWEPYNSDGQRGIKQTGKAMPLQFCNYVAKQVKAHIEGKKFKTTDKRVAKPQPKVSEAKLDFCMQSGYADQDAACKSCWLTATCPIYKASNN